MPIVTTRSKAKVVNVLFIHSFPLNQNVFHLLLFNKIQTTGKLPHDKGFSPYKIYNIQTL